MTDRLYTLQEAAVVLRKSERSVRRMLHDGSLRGCKIGGTWRIAERDLIEIGWGSARRREATATEPRQFGHLAV